jgi:neuronal cell adhesion molecule
VNVRVLRCNATSAEISWLPGRDNNDPILQYFVYYNTSHDGAATFCARVFGAARTAVVALQPWAAYSFHVVAFNKLGESARSDVTRTRCVTPQAKPSRNPTRVCTDLRDSGRLIVTWEVGRPAIDYYYLFIFIIFIILLCLPG